MTAQETALAGRQFAAQTMGDACAVTRGSGGQVFDPATGQYVTTPGAQVYTGPCRVKPGDRTDQVVEAGGQAVSLFPFTVSVPVSAVKFEVDDVVTVTASQLDPAMVGLVLRVRQVAEGSHVTARRLGCERNAG